MTGKNLKVAQILLAYRRSYESTLFDHEAHPENVRTAFRQIFGCSMLEHYRGSNPSYVNGITKELKLSGKRKIKVVGIYQITAKGCLSAALSVLLHWLRCDAAFKYEVIQEVWPQNHDSVVDIAAFLA